jgi:uncharacterized protein YcbK (DUF882 family)
LIHKWYFKDCRQLSGFNHSFQGLGIQSPDISMTFSGSDFMSPDNHPKKPASGHGLNPTQGRSFDRRPLPGRRTASSDKHRQKKPQYARSSIRGYLIGAFALCGVGLVSYLRGGTKVEEKKISLQHDISHEKKPTESLSSTDISEGALLKRGLHPAFASKMARVLQRLVAEGFHPRVISAVRTDAKQEAIRKEYKGKKGARPVAHRSNHMIGAAGDFACAKHIIGAAADFGCAKSEDEQRFFNLMHQFAVEEGLAPELYKMVKQKRGGKWVDVKVLHDREHVQLTTEEVERLGLWPKFFEEGRRDLTNLIARLNPG